MMCLTFTNVISFILLHRGHGFQLPTDVGLAGGDGNECVTYFTGGFRVRVLAGFFVVLALATLAESVLSAATFEDFPSASG